MASKNFWDDKIKSDKVISELSELKKIVETVEQLDKEITDSIKLLELIAIENDQELYKELILSKDSLEEKFNEFETLILLNGQYDKSNATVEIHAGAGGTEACDWALMLYRMYTRWCEKKHLKTKMIDYQVGSDEVGIKSATIIVEGVYAYGYLKNEKGIHRLVRLSPFDSNNRRHTSFASVDVVPEIEVNDEIQIDEKDLKIDVYRSSGAGGQHVNTTDSAVRITHLPTKTVVTCQNGRSQIQNKEQAMKILKSKLLVLKKEQEEESLDKLRGEQKNIEFGSQIRSYVMHPYSLVKDHRTNEETSNVSKVLDGDLDMFINANLRRKSNV